MAVSVNTSLVINITIVCCVMFVNCQQVSCDCSLTNDSECEVTAGIATCHVIPNCTKATIRGTTCHVIPKHLPECVTRLKVFLDSGQWDFNLELSPTSLPNLAAMTITTKDREVYEQVRVIYSLTSRFFRLLPALEELHLRLQAYISLPHEAFLGTTALRELDFTRTKYFHVDDVLKIIESLQAAPLQKLMLKNVLSRESLGPYMPEVDISAIVCPLSKTLRVLDLSHNDIQAVSFKTKLDWDCVYWLDTLDLSYNRITESGDSIRALSVLLFGVQYLRMGHQWSENGTEESLWQDNDYPVNGPPHGIPPFVPFADLLFYSPYTWRECPSMRLNVVFTFYINGLPYLYGCSDVGTDEVCFSDKVPCDLNFTLSVLWVAIAKTKADPFSYSVYCCSKTSNLPIWDISYSNFRGSVRQRNYKADIAGIRGFHNVVKLDLSYVDIHMSPLLFSDMPALEELNIAGNRQSRLNDRFETANLLADYLSNKPNLTLFNVSNAHLGGVEPGAFAESPALRTLDVSGNWLTSDTFFFRVTAGTKLSRIIASDNNISTVSPAMRAELDKLGELELDLSGNPLLCDCSTLAFLRWARRGEHVRLPPSSGTCINTHVFTDLSALDIDQLELDCGPLRATIFVVGITLLSVAAFLLIVCGIHKRWFIRHFLFTLQEKFHAWRNPDTTDIAYQFDAFVLYSGELSDRRWVHEQLVKTMENTYGFKLCIHLRNFIGGQDILDNVEMAIRKSRKVIAVLSPNFARSSWCMDEIQMARSVESMENRRKLIVILLEDFSSFAANIPPAIQCILQSRTYLEWPTKPRRRALFWRRLQKALYSKKRTTGEAQNEGFEMVSMD